MGDENLRCSMCKATFGESDECDDVVTRLYEGLLGELVCGCCRQGYVDYHQLDWFPELVYEVDDETGKVEKVATPYEQIMTLRQAIRFLLSVIHSGETLSANTVEEVLAYMAEHGQK